MVRQWTSHRFICLGQLRLSLSSSIVLRLVLAISDDFHSFILSRMGHTFSTIVVLLSFLVTVRGTPVTWFSPTDGQVYYPNDTLVAQWRSEYNMSSISFRLCTENETDADGVGDDECGLPIAPHIFQSNTTYEALM